MKFLIHGQQTWRNCLILWRRVVIKYTRKPWSIKLLWRFKKVHILSQVMFLSLFPLLLLSHFVISVVLRGSWGHGEGSLVYGKWWNRDCSVFTSQVFAIMLVSGNCRASQYWCDFVLKLPFQECSIELSLTELVKNFAKRLSLFLFYILSLMRSG